MTTIKLSANAARSLVASQSFHRSTSMSTDMPEREASTKHPEVTSPKENAKGDLENEATKLFVPPDGEVQVFKTPTSKDSDIIHASSGGHDEGAGRLIDPPASSRPLEPPEKNPDKSETVSFNMVVPDEDPHSHATQLPGTMRSPDRVPHLHQSHLTTATTIRAVLGAEVDHSQAVGDGNTTFEAKDKVSRLGRKITYIPSRRRRTRLVEFPRARCQALFLP